MVRVMLCFNNNNKDEFQQFAFDNRKWNTCTQITCTSAFAAHTFNAFKNQSSPIYLFLQPEAFRAFSQVATRLAIRYNTPKSKAIAELYGCLSLLLVRANTRSAPIPKHLKKMNCLRSCLCVFVHLCVCCLLVYVSVICCTFCLLILNNNFDSQKKIQKINK